MDQLLNPEPVSRPAGPEPSRPAAAQEPAVAVDSLTQTYGAFDALSSVSLAVSPGELVAVVGHSGSGKSTLLRLIAGLERPSEGSVAVGGLLVSGGSVFVPPEQRGVGMIFQDYALFPHLSVLRNVMFGLRRMPRDEAKATARRALDRVGLLDRETDYPHRLSGGEQQRVALARALVPKPNVILMDEPFSNLDRRTRDMVREETAAILDESGAAAILVTHDHDDAMLLADRILLLQAGRAIQTGTAEDLYRRPASLTVARFFSDFNEIEGICHGGIVATPLGSFPATGLAEDSKATVCIRHCDITIAAAAGRGPVGRIASRSFLGDVQLLGIRVPGLAGQVHARVPLQTSAGPGDDVVIAVERNAALVFPHGS